MKFNMLNTGQVIDFTFKRVFKNDDTKEIEGQSIPTEIALKPMLSPSSDENDNELIKNCNVALIMSIKNEIVELEFNHVFLIDFYNGISRSQLDDKALKQAVIEKLYPYSMAVVTSTLSLAGYGSVNMPYISF